MQRVILPKGLREKLQIYFGAKLRQLAHEEHVGGIIDCNRLRPIGCRWLGLGLGHLTFKEQGNATLAKKCLFTSSTGQLFERNLHPPSQFQIPNLKHSLVS